MITAYDNNRKTQLFLEHAQGCKSVLDLFEKVKTIEDTILQGDITEGLVKVMLDCKKFFGMKKVEYAENNQEGYDILCEDKHKNSIPVQVKFRSSEGLSNDELNSFAKVNWLEGYDFGYVIGNLRDVPSDWHNDKVMLFLKEDFRDIELSELVEFATGTEKHVRGPMVPRGYQPIWLEQLKKNISATSRGKILGPPGIGKTLAISTYIRLLKKNNLGFVGAPWIRLVNQNMVGIVEELYHHGYDPNFIVVNSSASIKSPTLTGLNDETHALNEYNIIKPTTDPKEIRAFIKEAKNNRDKKKVYIVFGCYGSTDTIIESANGSKFDYAAFDEAHNLTGHESKSHIKFLHDRFVKIARRAFVTATEKTYNGESDEVVAMNDEELFGATLCNCTFKDAIEHGNIKDYRVVMPEIAKKDIAKWWGMLKENLYVFDNGEAVTMAQVALKVLVYKMYAKYPITRMIAGFNRIDNAKNMSMFFATEDAITKHFGFTLKSTWVSSHETQSTNNRRIAEFADSQEKYVLCAPPMLKEGIDIKGIDKNGKYQYPNAVVFCDNKRGEIGIVQLAGRGLRMGEDKKELCYIGLPMIYGEKDIYNECFERAKEVITSLGCADDRVAQEIVGLRFGKKNPRKYKVSTKILEIPEILARRVEFKELARSMRLSIAQCVERASYEEYVELIKRNGWKSGAEYNRAKKEARYYATMDRVLDAFPGGDIYSDVGWVNHLEHATYEEHVEFIKLKEYKNLREYNLDRKPTKFYTTIPILINAYPEKDIYFDTGWRKLPTTSRLTREEIMKCVDSLLSSTQVREKFGELSWSAFCQHVKKITKKTYKELLQEHEKKIIKKFVDNKVPIEEVCKKLNMPQTTLNWKCKRWWGMGGYLRTSGLAKHKYSKKQI